LTLKINSKIQAESECDVKSFPDAKVSKLHKPGIGADPTKPKSRKAKELRRERALKKAELSG